MLHPERYSTTGVTARKKGVVVHDAESGDGATASLIAALQSPGDRPIEGTTRKYGSGYHAVTDGKGGYIAVADASMGPFAAPPLNKSWWHVCMPGFANQTREQWLDTLSLAHIRGVARFIVDKAAVDGFPLVEINAFQLLAGNGGYCGHVDVSAAWHQTDHTDPGVSFPWDELARSIAALAAPPSLPVENPPQQEDDVRQPEYVIVGNSDFPGPQRYLYDGMHVRILDDEADFHEVVAIWGLHPTIHPDPALALAHPVMKTGTWIAARLAE